MEIMTLGGYNEVGKNMTAVKVQDEIVVFDMGLYLPSILKFQEEGDPRNLGKKELIKIGAIPNDAQIEKESSKVKAVILGHAHLDHIGALPSMILNYSCPVIGTPYTIGILKTLLRDRKIDIDNRLKVLNVNTLFKISNKLTVEFVNITHSTIQTSIVILHTPEGKVVYTNDFKLDNHPVIGKKPDYEKLKSLGDGSVKVLILDSLNSTSQMKTPSEKVAREMLKDVVLGVNTENKAIVVTTFSSHIARLRSIIDFGKHLNRKIVFLGRSLEKYVGTA
ncbi:MBL fold metallo-hydrolase, partial [Candidatus Woesearchaeota archaeon]|nr:MBL fold metallo-hydrolase [Candidatus Woesearchaeota archaeon]